MNQAVYDFGEVASNQISIKTHEWTKNGAHNTEDIINDLYPRVASRIKDVNQKLWGEGDIVVFLFERYYLYNYSIASISQELQEQYHIQIPSSVLQVWMTRYFNWKLKDKNSPEQVRKRNKCVFRSMWNNRSQSIREKAIARVEEIVSGIVLPEVIEETFSMERYNSFKIWADKIKYLLRCYGYKWENPIDSIIEEYQSQCGSQILAYIIHHLCKKIAVENNLNIEIPTIKLQTILYRQRLMWERGQRK